MWQSGAESQLSNITNSGYVNEYTESPTPTPTIIPSITSPVGGKRYSFAANALLETVDIDMSNIREWAILDSEATSHFLVTAASVSDTQVAGTPLVVRLPDGGQVQSTHTCTLAIP